MTATISEQIRARLAVAISCTHCNQRKFTYRKIAEQANQIVGSATVNEDTVRRFATGGENIRIKQLDAIERWVTSQWEIEQEAEGDDLEREADGEGGTAGSGG